MINPVKSVIAIKIERILFAILFQIIKNTFVESVHTKCNLFARNILSNFILTRKKLV